VGQRSLLAGGYVLVDLVEVNHARSIQLAGFKFGRNLSL